MKKTFLLLIPASLTMLLASCGGQQADSQQGSTSDATSISAPVSEESSEASASVESEASSVASSESAESEEGSVPSSETSESEESSIPSSESSESEPEPEPIYNGVDHDFRLEAEDGVLDGTKVKRSANPAASNGLMAADINDCGQGLEWIHYAPVAGLHELKVAYWTGAAGSKHGIYLNGTKVADAVYEEANGWADGVSEAATVTVSVNLVQGYNRISLVKDGNSSDAPEYGGWAQIDYVDVVGTGAAYDAASLDFTVSEIVLEAERGYFHTGGLPFFCDTMGEHYAVGEINAAGHGVDLYFMVPVAGEYELKITYAQGDAGNIADVALNEETVEYELPSYEGQAYNVPHTSEAVVHAHCSSDTLNVASVARSSKSGGWFIIDSITLTPIAK